MKSEIFVSYDGVDSLLVIVVVLPQLLNVIDEVAEVVPEEQQLAVELNPFPTQLRIVTAVETKDRELESVVEEAGVVRGPTQNEYEDD